MTLAVLASVGIVVLAARAEPGPSAVLHGRADGRVRFTGDWVPVAASDKMFGRYAERSDTKGASVELDFCGTSVGLVHQAGGLGWEWGVITPDTGRALGLAEVRIDGGPPVEIDTSRDGRTLLAKGLPAGRHRVVVTNLGASRSPGGSGTIVVKGFWVDAGEIPDDTVRRAWLAADAVRGGEGWRARGRTGCSSENGG